MSLFERRYPNFVGEHENIGKISFRVALIALAIGFGVEYMFWQRVKKKMPTNDFKGVNPDEIVPKSKDIVPVDHEKLRKIVREKDQFLRDELGIKIVSSPEEYVYETTPGIENKEKFIEYLRNEFNKLK